MDALWPPQCLACGALVDEAGALCSSCWTAIGFIAPPHCHMCGLPFEFELGDGALCGACAHRTPAFARARSVMIYDEVSRPLVLAFKHADRTEAAPAFGRWLVRAGSDLLADADVIAPVPLHWTRLFVRRYNQAALLACVVGGLSGKPVAHDLVVRRKKTPSQGTMGRLARHRNLRGAFAIKSRAGAAWRGKRVLLVDDVMTTGATVSACARVLLRAGVSAVDVLTLARVVRSGP